MSEQMQVEVVIRQDIPGAWAVEAIRFDSDVGMELAIFLGPQAEERAYEHAKIFYGVEPRKQ